MNCINFPKMFRGNSTSILTDDTLNNNATLTCLHLLLGSESGTLFGDPDFGIMLRKYIFDQNNYILKDILIDEIYTKISTFCPQIFLERKNIQIVNSKSTLYVTITCKNRENFKTNTYNLKLYDIDAEDIE